MIKTITNTKGETFYVIQSITGVWYIYHDYYRNTPWTRELFGVRK